MSLAVSLTAFAAGAAAQPRGVAREFQLGVDAYRLGEYRQARVHLEKARALDPALPGPHRFLAAVAQAEERFADCVTLAAEALRVAPQSREVADTRKLHEDCRAADGRPSFSGRFGDGGALAVTARDAGSSAAVPVMLNGKLVGSTPMFPRALAAGPHEVKVGDHPTLRIEVLPGVVTDVVVALGPPPPGWLELGDALAKIRGLTITIDGEPVEVATRIQLPVGRHRVEVARAKGQVWQGNVEVGSGKGTKLSPIFPDSPATKRGKRR